MREATLQDIPDLLRMGRNFHEASGVEIPLDEMTLAKAFEHLILGPGFILISDGGMIGVIISPSWINSNYLTAQELFWWVEPDQRGSGIRLLEAAEKKCEELGAETLTMIHLATSMPEKVKSIYLKRGYQPLESHYTKVIKWR